MQYQHRYEEQRDSFREDLHFVHAETSYQRQMYQGQISDAHEEASALRKQLAACVRRYEEQQRRLRAAQASLHDASTIHTQLELKLKAAAAEKEVADDLENLLTDALRREQDKNETLEISFDVLESAYSFLARELVRTEHALEEGDTCQGPTDIRERSKGQEREEREVQTTGELTPLQFFICSIRVHCIEI